MEGIERRSTAPGGLANSPVAMGRRWVWQSSASSAPRSWRTDKSAGRRWIWQSSASILFLMALLLGLALSLPARADSGAWAALFAQANQRYEAGDFAGAAALYEQIVRAGGDDGRVYYNLGNAYFKAGQLGKAVLSYERARRLLPRDEDIQANLAFARSQVKGGPVLPNSGAAWEAIGRLHDGLRPDEKAWLALGLYLLVVGCGLIALFAWRWRRPASIAAVVLGVLLLATLVSFGIGVYEQERVNHAIVVASQAAVYSGPGESYLLETTLGEGNAVVVEETRGAWCRLSLAGNLQGWAACGGLESVRSQPQPSTNGARINE